MGKIFALTSLESDIFIVTLKCNPIKAIELRDEFSYIVSAYHMNKTHWNTINCNLAPTKQIKKLIDHSFDLIIAGFPKKIKIDYDNLLT